MIMPPARMLSRTMLSLMLAAVLLLAGCSRLNAIEGKKAPVVLPVWRIGFIGASGIGQSRESEMSSDGAQLAIKAINHAGGIAWHGKHYLLALDSSGQPAGPLTRIGNFAYAPSVVALFGPDDGATAFGTLSVADTAGMPELTLATDPGIANPTSNQHDALIFQMRPPDYAWSQAAARYVAHTASTGRIAVVAVLNTFGTHNSGAIDAALTAAGAGPVAHISLPQGLPDPAPAVSQIVASKASSIICACTDYEAATLIRALRAASWPGQFIDTMLDDDFMAEAGPVANGTIGITSWAAGAHTAGNASFIASFIAQYNVSPDSHAAALYDAVNIIANGLHIVGPNHAALARYLTSLSDFSGVQGTYDAPAADQLFGAQTVLMTALYVVKAEDGQAVLVQTATP